MKLKKETKSRYLKAELEDLYQKGRCEKNAFRRQCIAQEYTRKLAEYEQLDGMC